MSYLCSGDQLPTVKEVVAPLAINPNPVVGPALAASGLAVQSGRSGGTHPRLPRTTGGARSMIWLTWRQHRVQALGCQSAMYAFMRQVNGIANHPLTWFTPIPGLIGAGVLGREYEHGTWRLTWTQAVPRTRWLTSKILLIAFGIAVIAANLSAIFSWFRGPIDNVSGR